MIGELILKSNTGETVEEILPISGKILGNPPNNEDFNEFFTEFISKYLNTQNIKIERKLPE